MSHSSPSFLRSIGKFIGRTLLELFLFPLIMAVIGMGVVGYTAVTEGTPLWIGLLVGAVGGFIAGIVIMLSRNFFN